MKIVYSGNLGRTYDLETVVSAVRENPDFELHVAGYGDFACDVERVVCHGFLTAAAQRDLFAACDVGVVPMDDSSWVGIPNKFFDYSAAGLSIVSSLSGESAELLGRYGCGAVYHSGDVDSLAAAIRRAAQLPRGASRRLCEAEFDARRIYSDYVKTVIGRMFP